MKVLGQLEKAQFENITGNPSTALAAGRVWVDITTPSAVVPKFYNGSSVQSLALLPASGAYATTTSNVVGAAGVAQTINWANGPSQTITLTANCLVSFSNPPAAGQLCTLIVQQDASTPYQIRFQSDVYWQRLSAIPAVIPLGAIRVFKFISTPAYMTAISTVGNYSSQPISQTLNAVMNQAQFSPDGEWLCTVNQAGYALLQQVIKNTNNSVTMSPVEQNSLGPSSGAFAWHPSGKYIAFGLPSSPWLIVYGVTAGITTNVGISPGVLPGHAVTSVAWTPAGDALVCATSTTSPFLLGYSWANNAFSAAFSAPATTPPSQVFGIKFAPSGKFFAISYAGAPGVSIYAFSSSTGFGAVSSAPSPATYVSASQVGSLDWSPDGGYLALGITVSPYIVVWPVSSSGAFGTVVTSPTTLMTATAQSVCFSAQSDFVAAVQQSGNGLYVYPFSIASGGSFGTLLAAPSQPPPTTGLTGVTISPDNEVLAWYGAAPGYGVYQMPRSIKNSIMGVYL